MEKKVSIVLPVYNGEKYISESINSILAQTYSNWELIIVNDCSTDNTLQIIKAYEKEDNRIHIYNNDKNMKLPATLNEGFSHATGDYYTWTSDDNLYKPNALYTFVKYLSDNPNVDMVYSNYTNIDEFGVARDSVSLLDAEYIVAGNVCGASFMYTSCIAKSVGEYDVNLFLAEDYDYWIRISKHGMVEHIADDLYLYRRHHSSLSDEYKSFVNMQTYRALEKNFLSLYYKARTSNLQYSLFDQMLKRVDAKNYNYAMELILNVEKGYKRYLRFEKVKKRIKSHGLILDNQDI